MPVRGCVDAGWPALAVGAGATAWLWRTELAALAAAVVVQLFFFFKDSAATEVYTSLHTLSLHDALPISRRARARRAARGPVAARRPRLRADVRLRSSDRKSTRLNSSHVTTSRMPSS